MAEMFLPMFFVRNFLKYEFIVNRNQKQDQHQH